MDPKNLNFRWKWRQPYMTWPKPQPKPEFKPEPEITDFTQARQVLARIMSL